MNHSNQIEKIIYSAEWDGVEKINVELFQINTGLRGFVSTGITISFKHSEAWKTLLSVLFNEGEYIKGEEIKSDGTSSWTIFYKFKDGYWIKIKTKDFSNIIEDYHENLTESFLIF